MYIKLWQDSDSESPRSEDCANLSTMLSTHTRYNLGDEGALSKIQTEIRESSNYSDKLENDYDFSCIVTLVELADKLGLIAAQKPLYIYDHSGITIATTPFSCRWDSGQYGIAYITKEEARKEYGIKRITKSVVEKLEEIIDGEVEDFDVYVRGDIYGFSIFDDDDEVTDSCGGFYTSDTKVNGMKDHVEEKHRHLLEKAEVCWD